MFNCQAILFDLDGTLVDSIAAVDRAWAKWAVRHGLDPKVIVPQIHGRRAIDSLRLLIPNPAIDLEKEFAWLEEVEAADTEGVVLIKGALDFVYSVPNDRWSIVTSGTSPVAMARMGAVGLAPAIAVFGEDVANGKPAPDPYLLAAERLGVSPQDCVVFEDTVAGVQSGKAAGMRVIAISADTDRPDLEIADLVVADYTALKLTLKQEGLLIDRSPLK